ncbi:MAG: hypothetical protein ACKOW9_01790 [Candidatus Paceibacterota bacterium]
MTNFCNGTGKIKVTSGLHVASSYPCPGCDSCKPKQSKPETTPTTEEIINNLRKKSGGWKD